MSLYISTVYVSLSLFTQAASSFSYTSPLTYPVPNSQSKPHYPISLVHITTICSQFSLQFLFHNNAELSNLGLYTQCLTQNSGNNITLILNKQAVGVRTGFNWLRTEPCEHWNTFSSSIKGWERLEQVSYCKLLKKGSEPELFKRNTYLQ